MEKGRGGGGGGGEGCFLFSFGDFNNKIVDMLCSLITCTHFNLAPLQNNKISDKQ